jgi:hypothetical protein
MNANVKLRLANHLTTITAIVAIVQTTLTTPPFNPQMVAVLTAICTLVTLIGTYGKQYLSPEVSNTGQHVTIGVFVAAVLTGILDFTHVLNLTAATANWIKWGITVATLIVNIYSKQIFPSVEQKDRMKDLKFQK